MPSLNTRHPARPRRPASGSQNYEYSYIDDMQGTQDEQGGETYELQQTYGSANGEPKTDTNSPRAPASPGTPSQSDDFELYSPEEDKAVRRKLDRRLVGFLALLYALSFLDRSSTHISPIR
ncbi:hypothetical protein M011DRAFT_38278 [Sporormia fimetaria CBS 119925]|uniref:MFS general substrate transporter n=1 Tax=Sporormia fimetaria CBS 119925 TaxID=1340428 RepID=A0A6A6VC82_9PLEO|nr:hypothetical protein M011DRAFT_38278 [Sporormia fimetaria CBS 119925]